MVCLKDAISHPVVGRVTSYKILALLPRHGRRWLYRVKTILEREARVAEQDELVPQHASEFQR
ncbi:hypothetical protein [Hyphomicrobium sp.]|uniref:hypothetical protein n=1 Tax=Hyphomicrobium sp. TaxID=82 RepID=UPI002E34FECE|nr:hypothetical protein [Hyphomicrobium sp.]HEX2839650.1 hypothetical protein [Hyphomicrobium sp.]